METTQPMYVTAERITSTGPVTFDVMFGDTSYQTKVMKEQKGLVIFFQQWCVALIFNQDRVLTVAQDCIFVSAKKKICILFNR